MQPNRIKFLDGFRFILAFWVVIGHFYTLIGGVNYIKLPKLIEDFLTLPIIAVYGFMIITGFLMTYNYALRETKEPVDSKRTFLMFWLRRIFRLYPVYLLLIVIAFFSFTYIAGLAEKNLIYFTGTNITSGGFIRPKMQPSLLDLLTHVLFLHGFFPQFQGSILGVTWSLSLEMQFYFSFPFVYLAFFKKENALRSRLMPLLFISVILFGFSNKLFHLICVQLQLPDFFLPSIITYGLLFFLFGMITAGVKLKKIHPIYLVIGLLVTVPFQFKLTLLLINAFLILLFLDELKEFLPSSIFKSLNIIRSSLSGKLAAYGANISYALYLIHTLVISLVLDQVITKASFYHLNKTAVLVVAFLSALLICILVSYLLYRFIEKPFIALGRTIVRQIVAKKEKRQEELAAVL